MSLRYVWSKWDKSTKTTYSKLETNITETGVKNLASYSVISLTVYKSATVNSTTGAITLSNEQTILTSKITSGYSSWTYDVYFTGSDNKYYFGRVRDAFYSGNNAYTIDCFATKSVTAKATTSTIKGSTQYDNVSGTQNAYNSNGVTGDYWYVLLGSDTIDPSALTMTGEVKAGSPSHGFLFIQVVVLIGSHVEGASGVNVGFLSKRKTF